MENFIFCANLCSGITKHEIKPQSKRQSKPHYKRTTINKNKRNGKLGN